MVSPTEFGVPEAAGRSSARADTAEAPLKTQPMRHERCLMNFIALQSTDLPPGQRFDWWCDLISHDVAPTRITSDHTDDFRATAGAMDLSDLRITTMSFPALRSERT
ncbi:hypothetical protein AB0B45_50030, partial [Nonomuraea sp. NPDC049152]